MQRRNFPASAADLILLYGFGLALLLSLVFNGYLLYNQCLQPRLSEYQAGYGAYALPSEVWQQQLSECQRDNQQKDSLIHQLVQSSDSLPERAEGLSRQFNVSKASHFKP